MKNNQFSDDYMLLKYNGNISTVLLIVRNLKTFLKNKRRNQVTGSRENLEFCNNLLKIKQDFIIKKFERCNLHHQDRLPVQSKKPN